jgi:hypothetical protein
MDVAEGSSALEVAAMEDPAPKGGARSDPAPKGVEAGSPSTASMDVDVGSPPVQSEEAVVTHLSMTLTGLVTLETSEPDARSLPPAEVHPSHAFDYLNAQLDSKKMAHEVNSLGCFCFASLASMLSVVLSFMRKKRALVASHDNLDRLYRDASTSLTILERSHRFTMSDLDHHRDDLRACQDEVS